MDLLSVYVERKLDLKSRGRERCTDICTRIYSYNYYCNYNSNDYTQLGHTILFYIIIIIQIHIMWDRVNSKLHAF